jgi:hypothetical protein
MQLINFADGMPFRVVIPTVADVDLTVSTSTLLYSISLYATQAI